MGTRLDNKIDAEDKNLSELLSKKKFFIDYFQREYRWQTKHITALVEDLTDAFLQSYTPGDSTGQVEFYRSYFMGPLVFCIDDDGRRSIIDGQQRITSLTLFLIYLNNMQKQLLDDSSRVPISDLIFSAPYGVKSFNIDDDTRSHCLESLYATGDYAVTDDDDETVSNMAERYHDIDVAFPEEITKDVLPNFIYFMQRLHAPFP